MVTDLSTEDLTGMKHLRARKLAQVIVNSRLVNQTSGVEDSSDFSRQLAVNRTGNQPAWIASHDAALVKAGWQGISRDQVGTANAAVAQSNSLPWADPLATRYGGTNDHLYTST